ncbi:hypothetical protein [Ferruginibacter profundus]
MRRKIQLLVSASLVFLFLLLNFIDFNINEYKGKIDIHEKFDPSLSRLNSLSKLESYIDSLAGKKNIVPGSLEYAVLANDIVSLRFYHKYATQNLNENWIASLAQKFTGLYVSSKITADDILTKPYGYCGQQSAVLMELLQRKKLDCRVLYTVGHFVIQSYINGKWCYFDVDREPDITIEQRANEKWLYNSDSLRIAYKTNKQVVNKIFGNPVSFKMGKINEIQGAHAQLFQSVTKILSRLAFFFPLIWYVSLKRKRQIATNNQQQAAKSWHYYFYGNERISRRPQGHQPWPGLSRFFNG